jgi:flagellar biosynthetic protein FliR
MDHEPVVRFALLLVRPGMVVMLAPGLGGRHIPALVKIGLTVLLALGLLPAVALPTAVDGAHLPIVVLHEVAVGLALAFTVQALIAGVEFAGHLSSSQIGFSYGATIDPASGVRSTVLVSLYGVLATVTFLGVNGHHAILRALAASYGSVPVAAGQVSLSLVEAVRDLLGMVFLVGFRAAPSLTFMVIGYPLRIVIGLFVVATLIYSVPAVTASMIERALVLGARTAGSFR